VRERLHAKLKKGIYDVGETGFREARDHGQVVPGKPVLVSGKIPRGDLGKARKVGKGNPMTVH